MSFLNNFFHHAPEHPDYQGPPQPPPPWAAEWDGQDQRWIFVNGQTGERSGNFPQAQQQGGYGGQQGGYGGQQGGGYGGQQGGGYGGQQGGYGGQQGGGYGGQQGGYGGGQQEYNASQEAPKSHTGRNAALMGVAGLAGGALLMHEGEKVEGDWRRDEDRLDDRVDYDKDRVENSFSNAGQDIEQFPDDAARWTGRKVGEVEDIPGDVRNDYDDAKYGIENKFDNARQDVEDVPYDIGEGVGRVENYGDRVDNNYDAGRDEERYGRDDY